MVYQFNLFENRTELNELNDVLKTDDQSLLSELSALIKKLNGENIPERIGNC